MKKIIVLIVVLGYSVLGFPQYGNTSYPKDGAFGKGMVSENRINQLSKIESSLKSGLQKNETNDSYNKPGVFGLFEVGYGKSLGHFKAHFLKYKIIGSYQFNPWFAAGIGTGLRYYYAPNFLLIRDPLLPILGEMRFHFFARNRISPYFVVSGGYTLDLGDNFQPYSLILYPALGVSLKTSTRIILNFSLGYDLESYQVEYIAWEVINPPQITLQHKKENRVLNALSLNIGLSF